MLYLIPKGSPKVTPLFIFIKKVILYSIIDFNMHGCCIYWSTLISAQTDKAPGPLYSKASQQEKLYGKVPSSTALINVLFHITSISQHVCVQERVEGNC